MKSFYPKHNKFLYYKAQFNHFNFADIIRRPEDTYTPSDSSKKQPLEPSNYYHFWQEPKNLVEACAQKIASEKLKGSSSYDLSHLPNELQQLIWEKISSVKPKLG